MNARINRWVAVLLWIGAAFAIGLLLASYTHRPVYCPTEDSCSVTYSGTDHSWHIVPVTP